MLKKLSRIIPALIAIGIIACCNISITQIVTGKGAYFGISNILMPAIAAIGGIAGSLFMFAFIGIKIFSGKLLITKGVPTLAAIYSAQCSAASPRSRLINILVPLTMMIMFITHPTGSAAWTYSLFWLIPICCEVLHHCNVNALFTRLLAATFVAHAIGSVMWLYCIPTTPETWFGLLAVVPAERLVFASGATIAAIFLIKISQALRNAARTIASTSRGKKVLPSQSASDVTH